LPFGQRGKVGELPGIDRIEDPLLGRIVEKLRTVRRL
jgi:hypothetical protein